MARDDFFLEEYKTLREEIGTKLKARLDFHSWGLIAVAALYSYIISKLDITWAQPWLFWVPAGFCASMVYHLLEEFRIMVKASNYIREQIEPWMAKRSNEKNEAAAQPEGWETFLKRTANQKEARQWNWSPLPLWCWLTATTAFVALILTIAWAVGCWPPKA